MKKSKSVFLCGNCGREESRWLGRCPECGEWNSFTETVAQSTAPSGTIRTQQFNPFIYFNMLSYFFFSFLLAPPFILLIPHIFILLSSYFNLSLFFISYFFFSYTPSNLILSSFSFYCFPFSSCNPSLTLFPIPSLLILIPFLITFLFPVIITFLLSYFYSSFSSYHFFLLCLSSYFCFTFLYCSHSFPSPPEQ